VRALIQRVRSASVSVAGAEVARVGPGMLVLLGAAAGDGEGDVAWTARKVAELRVFADGAGKMNRSLAEVGGEVLAVPQFTLLGDCRRGRRPSFTGAAAPEEGRRLFEAFVASVAAAGLPVRTGVFGADMLVAIENDGPVTFLLDSRA